MKTIIKALAVSALALTVSCGDGSEQTSELDSLTGFPCQEYGHNVADQNFFCSSVQAGGTRVNVLYKLEGFNGAQLTKLKSALKIAGERFSSHFTPVQPSQLMQCITRNTTNSKDPQGSTLSVGFKDDLGKATWSLTTLNMAFMFHAQSKRAVVVKAFDQALDSKGSTAAAKAFIGNDKLPVTNPLDFSVNRIALNQPDNAAFDYSANAFAGAVIHELLHTRGYTHPETGRSVGPLVYEVGNCISNPSHNSKATSLTGRRPLPHM